MKGLQKIFDNIETIKVYEYSAFEKSVEKINVEPNMELFDAVLRYHHDAKKDDIKAEKSKFTWGKVVTYHIIDMYLIVEYKPTAFDGVSPKVPRQFEKESLFHPYIGGVSTSTSYRSIDAALAGCIARKRDGTNSSADRYFMKMIL